MMAEASSYRERMQSEFEASLEDVLSILRLGFTGSAASKSADFIAASFFKVPKDVRRRAILDPRVVASLEEIQRLIAAYGDAALSRPEWIEFSGVVLRLEFFCLIFFNETGCSIVRGFTDQWISIPGTSLYVMTSRENRQITINRGVVLGSEVLDARLTVGGQHDDLPLIAIPETPLLPPIANKRLLSLSRTQRDEWRSAIAGAFELLRCHGPSLALVRDYAWLLVPLVSDRDGYFSSISFNSLPNAIYTSLHTDLMFAETLVHEADHQWLYSVARFEEFWILPDHLQEPLYRSPWRDDPRPLDGLFRGASAFVRVGLMWAALARSLPRTHNSLDWIRKRAVLCNYQAIDALRTVRMHGELSAFGQQLLASLVGQATETRDRLGELEDFSELLRWAEVSQQEHNSAWLAHNPVLETFWLPLCAEDYVNYGMPT